MAWKVELDPATEHYLDRLDPQVARRILLRPAPGYRVSGPPANYFIHS